MNRQIIALYTILGSLLLPSIAVAQKTIPEEFPANMPSGQSNARLALPSGFNVKKYTRFPTTKVIVTNADSCFQQIFGDRSYSAAINPNRMLVGIQSKANASFTSLKGTVYGTGTVLSYCVDAQTGTIFGSDISGSVLYEPNTFGIAK